MISCDTQKLPNKLPITGSKDAPWTTYICYICESKDSGCYPKNLSAGIRTEAGLRYQNRCHLIFHYL